MKINVDGTIAANVGQVPTSAITITIATSFAYSITFTTPHPYGDGYVVFATPKTTSATNAFVVRTCNQSTYTITVWNRTVANAIITQAFYVHSVP